MSVIVSIAKHSFIELEHWLRDEDAQQDLHSMLTIMLGQGRSPELDPTLQEIEDALTKAGVDGAVRDTVTVVPVVQVTVVMIVFVNFVGVEHCLSACSSQQLEPWAPLVLYTFQGCVLTSVRTGTTLRLSLVILSVVSYYQPLYVWFFSDVLVFIFLCVACRNSCLASWTY